MINAGSAGKRVGGISMASGVLLWVCGFLVAMLMVCMSSKKCGAPLNAIVETNSQSPPEHAVARSVQNDAIAANPPAPCPPPPQCPAQIPAAQKRAQDEPGLMWLGGKRIEGWKIIPSLMPEEPIVYSIGAGEDISFDVEVMNTFEKSKVFLFDMTPKAVRYVNKHLPKYPRLEFTDEGIGLKAGTLTFMKPEEETFVSSRFVDKEKKVPEGRGTFEAKVNTIENWMKKFGHSYIDVLKLDCEYMEYDLLEDWLGRYEESPLVRITQLNVELHVNPKPETKDEPDVVRHVRLVNALRERFRLVATKQKHFLFVRKEKDNLATESDL